MRKITTIISILAVLLQSCTGSKKTMQLPPYITPDLPYRALDKKGLDTTFDYQVLQNTIHATLPDSIFGKKVTGAVEFYSMINADKHVIDVKVIECRFYKMNSTSLVYEFNVKMNNEVDGKLKNYLLEFIQDKPFKQNKTVTLPQHPTYCYIRFYK
jgi:hypothetical protein